MLQKLGIGLVTPGGRADIRPPPPSGSLSDKLSARELECARLVAKGFSNKEVAFLLEISPWTVAAHLKATFLKLGVRRRAELAYVMWREM